MTDGVRIYEVSLRDGLQNEPDILPTETKVVLLDRLLDAGLTDIEVASFVRPRAIPQLSDAAEVARRLPRDRRVRFWALVPNVVGLERALDAEIRHVATFVSASESHNKRNVNRTIAESMAGLRKVITTAKAEGLGVRSYISTVYGCPFEGDVSVHKTRELALELLECGSDEIALGDTIGAAKPLQVREVLSTLQDGGVPLDRVAVHFHDTRGTAVVNAWIAWECGVRTFDGSVGGVGGCPFAPGAAGNVATEDLVNLFHESGVGTSADLDRVCEAAATLEEALGRPLPSRYLGWWRGRREREARQSRSA
jgi:hydroxymethylglutaryl-CoA lyase